MEGEKYKIMAKDWLSDSLNLCGVIKTKINKEKEIIYMSIIHIYEK